MSANSTFVVEDNTLSERSLQMIGLTETRRAVQDEPECIKQCRAVRRDKNKEIGMSINPM